MYHPNFSDFTVFAEKGNIIPVYTEILADCETPVSAFSKIDDGRYSFLLESVEGGEKWLGTVFWELALWRFFRVQGDEVIIEANQEETTIPHKVIHSTA